MRRHNALILMLLCLMVAAILRLPDLTLIPPGAHYDEAANGVLAAEIGLTGERPLFITSYTGKEVLFFYIAGGFMRLLGDSLFTLRLSATFIGLLTIAVTYWLGKELFQDRRIAIFAAALLAVSFWHLLFSRLGFRAISQPLLQGLTVAALLRGYRHHDWRWLTIAGVFLGLTAYTYLAARLFPLLLLLALLPILWPQAHGGRRWLQTAVVFFVALIISLPLLRFFWQHPQTFWVRIAQVGPGSEGLSLPESLLRSLGMIFLQGDPYWRFNIPGRPLFDWFFGGLLIVGWFVLLFRWRQMRADWQRSGALLLILTPWLMILPTALATNEIVPSNLRAIGLMPFIFYLPPLGLMALLDDIHARFGRPSINQTVTGISLVILIGGSLWTKNLYFFQWGQQPEVYYETDADLTAVAQFLDTMDTEHKTVYVAAQHYQHPTLAFLSQKYGQIKWLPQSGALVFPAQGTAVYIFPHTSPLPAWAAPYFNQAAPLASPEGPDGNFAFIAYELETAPSLTFTHSLTANFGQALTLQGYDLDTAVSGEILPLTLYWQVNQPPAGDFTPFVHLEDNRGRRWSQVETFAYPAAQWTAGEQIVQRIDVPVPPGTPPGEYRLRVGLFTAATGEQLPRLDEAGRYAGSSLLIEDVPVTAGGFPDDLPRPPFVLEKEIQPHLRLLGFERGKAEVATGEPYGIAWWWLATQPLVAMTAQVALVNNDGAEYILTETQPVYDTYPFDQWQPPQFVIDPQTFAIPDTVPAGDYQLVARFLNEQGEPAKRINMGPLRVNTAQRLFTPPPFETAVDAIFGDEIKLLGYSLNAAPDPGHYTLNLIWQAARPPAADYTVFVHLLQPDGTCDPCAWQQDTLPQQGEYPTSRWLADEVVVDTYQIMLPPGTPPGTYPLEIGLYIAETGQRLQTLTADGHTVDALLLEPLITTP